MKDLAFQLAPNDFFVTACYIVILSIVFYLIHFPLSVYSGFIWEHKFGLSNQKFAQWLADNLKGALLGLAVFLVLIEAIYFFLRLYPGRWWIYAGAFWLFFSFVLAKLTPSVIIPIFYKYVPVQNDELRRRIKDLFRSCRVALNDVYAIDLSSKTKKANAFLCGLGKNRRVVLSDTLIDNFNIDEIEVVVAHELGHYKHHDILKLLLLSAVTIFGALYLIHHFLLYAVSRFGLTGVGDIAFFPVVALALMLFTLVTTPLTNAYSRRIEREADQFSIETTRRPKDFISLMDKLRKMNLSELEPGRFIEMFFYDHPPVQKRIRFAEQFKING